MGDDADLVAMAATIVSAYFNKNTVSPADLPALIREVHGALGSLAPNSGAAAPDATPAVSVKMSVAAGHVVCLVCGVKLKSLKRHLGSRHDLTPDEYRARYSLAHTHPIVSPAYAAARSKLAIRMGLGRKRGRKG